MKAPFFTEVYQLSTKGVWRALFILTTLFSLMILLPINVLASGSDFLDTELRVDLTSVNLAKDYVESIFIGGLPTTGATGDFTTAWLGVNLSLYDGTLYSGKFTQVGFMTDKTGPTWFVYSEVGVTCFQGHPVYGNLGCQGDYNDRVTIGQWQKVELVTYNQGFWIARVYDQYGIPLDVAQINYNDSANAIYAALADTEEGYYESTDPYILANFAHSHPQYFIGGNGYPFADWPASSGSNKNSLYAIPTNICPKHYYAKFNWQSDPRAWYAGSKTQGSGVCSGNPF